MRVQISKWGNSSALRLPKSIMAELRLQPGQEVELSVAGGELRLRPVKARRLYRIEDLVAEMNRLGPEHEPQFEDWDAVETPWPGEPPRPS